ncbi:hypothetical protein [Catenulispora rubra]|uniref:hypothetical protein n=1 Tax=Catenulispora rubra TaxID=280293 RepID=UPI0018923F81|nr:hypothetical protein [Catenulispora rubra]
MSKSKKLKSRAVAAAVLGLALTGVAPAAPAGAAAGWQLQPGATAQGVRPAPAPAPAAPAIPAVQTAQSRASAAARASGKPVVVGADTDAASQVRANPDGTFTLTESTSPVRALRDGVWVAIDPTLSRRPDGSVQPAATATGVVFSGGGKGPMAELTQDTKTLSFSWPTPLPAPTLAGPVATYADVLPGVDLRLTANSAGFSQLLVVHDAQAAKNPTLRMLTLTTSESGVSVAGTPDGGAVATDAQGNTVFHADRATMWDSSQAVPAKGATTNPANAAGAAAAEPGSAAGAGSARRAEVGVTVTAHSETLVPDQALLTSPTTKFPAYIDPAWSGNPSQQHWARISDNGDNIYDSTSTATNDHPREGYDNWPDGNGERARTYYTVDTSGVKNAIILGANLYVKDYWSAKWTTPEPVDMEATCDPAGWSSSDLNWSKQPCWLYVVDSQKSDEAGCPSACYVTPSTLQFTATKEVAAAAAAGNSHMSFALVSPDESNADQWKQFASGGGATLSVTYTVRPQLLDGTGVPKINGAVKDSGSWFISDSTPTLSARASDSDGEGVQMHYTLKNSAGTVVGSGLGPATGTTVNGTDWTTGTLADGGYSWQATDTNASGYWDGHYDSGGGWVCGCTAVQSFTVDTTAPNAPGVVSAQFPAKTSGAAYTDVGKFTFFTSGDNVKGYMYSLDGDLSGTVYNNGSGSPPTLSGTVITPGKTYWATADNGTGAEVVNGWAQPVFAPGTVGPHRVYVRAVDQAGNTGPETTYLFYAGFTTPVFAYGDKLVDGDSTATPPIPAGTYSAASSANTALIVQKDCCGLHFADGAQAMLSGTGLAAGDSATFSFSVPKTGVYDLGANLTRANDYGQYSLVLDKGSTAPATLVPSFDAYSATVITYYRDFGAPRDASGNVLQLSAGIHTLTLSITGKNASAQGYQAGIDFLRVSPMSATCSLTALTACLDNTAISQDTNTGAADADGGGSSFSAADLAAQGWTPGAAVTIDGAPMTVPAYAAGSGDNIAASGQTVTVPAGVADAGNAVVFLVAATDGAVTNAGGSITYSGSCGAQSYTLDTVPDWTAGPATSAVVSFAHRNLLGNQQQATTTRLYAVAVPLVCPGQPIASVSLPVVSNGVVAGVPALHVFGIGIRGSSYANSPANTENWTGTWSARQDFANTGTLTAQTVRIPVHVSLGNATGGSVRVHLSNALGTAPVTLDDVSVAVQSSGAVPVAPPARLTFGGSTAVTMIAGGDAVSDPVPLSVAQESTLLVSLHAAGTVSRYPAHASSQQPVYLSAANTDAALDATGAAFTGTGAATTADIAYLTAVDVLTPGATTGSLVLYGDQTVNADTASGDGQHHLSDVLAADLAAGNGGVVPYGVLGEGRDSWNVSNNLLPTVTSGGTPLSALDPVDRDVLEQGNVRTVLISTGTADILAGASATDVENRLVALSQQIRHFTTDDSSDPNVVTNNGFGLTTVYVATIPPNAAFGAGQEAVREAVNSAIKGSAGAYLSGNADGVIDFAAAVSTTGTDAGTAVNTAYLYNSNGTYYPNDLYYAALANQFIVNTTSQSTVGIKPMALRR